MDGIEAIQNTENRDYMYERSKCTLVKMKPYVRKDKAEYELVYIVIAVLVTNLFLSFYFDADMKSYGPRDCGFVGPFFQMIPDIHFSGKGAHLQHKHFMVRHY